MKRVLLGLLMALTLACSRASLTDRVNASVVHILASVTTDFGQSGTASCTGFVIIDDLSTEVVMTAHHCLGKNITADGRPALVIDSDDYFDLAVLSVPGLAKPVLPIASDIPKVGDRVLAVGYGFGWDHTMALTLFVINNGQKPDKTIPRGIITQGGLIGGQSGGPMVNMDGKVVAVNQRSADGTGYGVTIPIIKAFLFNAGL